MLVQEPVPPQDFAALARLADQTGIPLATGERRVDRGEFNSAFASGGVSVIRSDICQCPGLLDVKKIAAHAATRTRHILLILQ